MRLLRVKNGAELRMSAISQNFNSYKIQLIRALEEHVMNDIGARSVDFEEQIRLLVSIYINSSNVTHAGIIPDTNGAQFYIVLCGIAIIKFLTAEILQNK